MSSHVIRRVKEQPRLTDLDRHRLGKKQEREAADQLYPPAVRVETGPVHEPLGEPS